MDGFGSHTYQWVNAQGEAVWVKYHFKTDQGVRTLTTEEGAERAGLDPNFHVNDLRDAIDRGDQPSWTLKVQIMPVAEAASYRFNPFDLTKVWSQKDYPLIEVGRMTLDRNPDNYFADVEQAAFDPGNFVPGIGPSPDKMLQGRLFAYGDAHRYRLGVNHTQLPVNAPHAAQARNYGRDGLMRFDGNSARAKNYEPNSFDGPVQSNQPLYTGLQSDGASGAYEAELRGEDDDFVQAGMLYRLIDDGARDRLAGNLGGLLAKVSREDIVARSVEHFRRADPEYGARVEAAIRAARSGGAVGAAAGR
jgi:catalase